MIVIKKNKEPQELTQYRKQPDASYENMHGAKLNPEQSEQDVYHIVLDSLLREQGYLCAYCMCRIPKKRGNPPCTIEHIIAQSDPNGDPLSYKNMVAVCSGNRNANDNADKTCDARRGNKKLHVNPLDESTIKEIEYQSTGIIYSQNLEINTDLNDRLNLNCISLSLPETRKKVLDALKNDMAKKGLKNNSSFRERCQKQLQYYETQEKKKPYVGILIWWLKKHIR